MTAVCVGAARIVRKALPNASYIGFNGAPTSTEDKNTRDIFGDYDPVGAGVCEFRIDYGPGYRVYLAQHGKEIILLLIEGDKSSPRQDIEKARELNEQYE